MGKIGRLKQAVQWVRAWAPGQTQKIGWIGFPGIIRLLN